MIISAALPALLVISAPAQDVFVARTFTNQAQQLTYEVKGQGTPVVVLAGGPGLGPNYMYPAADKLSLFAKAIVFHQRGTGLSKVEQVNPDTINVRLAIADLEALRKHLGVPKLTLLGHSWGGMLAQAYAATHPSSTAKLILLSSGGPDFSTMTVLMDNIAMRLSKEDQDELAEAGKLGDTPEGASRSLTALLPGYFYSREEGLKFKASVAGKLELDRAVSGLLRVGFDVRKELSNFKGPVELIQGRQDPIDSTTAFFIKDYLPQMKVHWIEQCGHFPWLEQPKEFERLLTAALKS